MRSACVLSPPPPKNRGRGSRRSLTSGGGTPANCGPGGDGRGRIDCAGVLPSGGAAGAAPVRVRRRRGRSWQGCRRRRSGSDGYLCPDSWGGGAHKHTGATHGATSVSCTACMTPTRAYPWAHSIHRTQFFINSPTYAWGRPPAAYGGMRAGHPRSQGALPRPSAAAYAF